MANLTLRNIVITRKSSSSRFDRIPTEVELALARVFEDELRHNRNV